MFLPEKNIYSLIISILGIITVICGSKGLVIASFANLIYSILYLLLSYSLSYYGEVIIYLLYMIPINVMTVISWYKNRNKDNESIVEINKLSKKEYGLVLIVGIICSIIFYFILKMLNTDQLIISTLSLIGTVVATYLYYRRSSNYAFGYIFNDVILILLWGVTIKNGYSYLPLIITYFVYFFNDLYGLYSWKKREKIKGE